MYRFHFTHHFLQRHVERTISVEYVKSVINSPDQKDVLKSRTMHGGKLIRFKKTSKDGKVLIVVADIKDKECYVMTAVYET